MTLRHFDGFELGDNGIATDYSGNPTLYSTSATGTAFGYGRYVGCGNNGATLRKTISAASKVISGVRILPATIGGLTFLGDSGATQHITVTQDSGGSLQVWRGGWGSTLIASATLSPAGIWRYMEVAVTISDTVGTVEVRIDGATTPIINFTGDTKNGGTNTTIDQVALTVVSPSGSNFDDWYICDTAGTVNNSFLGDVRVYTLSPSGAGNYTQFVPSTGSNYTCVDEQPYNTTDYVGSPTSANRDSYALGDLPAGVSTVFGTIEVAVVQKSDAGAASIKQSMRIAATDYDTGATALPTSWQSIRNLREVNPNTGAAWTAAGVNGAEMGVTVG